MGCVGKTDAETLASKDSRETSAGLSESLVVGFAQRSLHDPARPGGRLGLLNGGEALCGVAGSP